MWKKYNKYKVLKVFLDEPLRKGQDFQLREISRKVKLAPKSVGIYLNELIEEGLVLKEAHRIHGYPLYYANRDGDKFRLYKRLDTIRSISESGLLERLSDKLTPGCIVLFGSAARGEDTQDSDLDIFVQCSEIKVDLEAFEKTMKRKISLFFSRDVNDLSAELRNNIINGVVLDGYLKVF